MIRYKGRSGRLLRRGFTVEPQVYAVFYLRGARVWSCPLSELPEAKAVWRLSLIQRDTLEGHENEHYEIIGVKRANVA